MKVIRNPENIEYLISVLDDLETYVEEEETGLSDKPWKNSKKKPKKRNRYSEDEWQEQSKARKRYLREWEEDMRYAEELANEGM